MWLELNKRQLKENTWQVLIPVRDVMAESIKLVTGIPEVWETALPL